jgi:hypothetical protein
MELPAGTGHSYLALPGTTPYTKGSELENAETSAVGRALVMAGIPAKNVASAGEIKSKKSNGGATLPATAATNTGGAGREGPATTRLAGEDNKPAPSPPSSGSAEEQVAKPGGEDTAAACSSCGSIASSFNKPDGNPLALGFVRCVDCGTVRKEAA